MMMMMMMMKSIHNTDSKPPIVFSVVEGKL